MEVRTSALDNECIGTLWEASSKKFIEKQMYGAKLEAFIEVWMKI
jgi:hypothetical protein